MRMALGGLCLALGLAQPAYAAAIVVELGSPGHACYEATLTTPSPDTDRNAIAACDQAVAAASPDNEQAIAYVNRSDIRLRMQDYDNALSDAQKAVALAPNLAAAHLNRAAAMVGLQRDAEAVAALTEVSLLTGVDLELVYYNRAIAEEHMGNIKGAYLDYRKALEANPKFKLAADQLTRFQVVTR